MVLDSDKYSVVKDPQRCRVLIADDHEIVRTGVRTLVQSVSYWEVVGEAGDGRDAVQKANELRPDLVVLDIGMPLLNGLEAARQMLRSDPRCRILILSMHDSDLIIREILDIGARGYVLKSDTNRDLLMAIKAVRNNKTFFTAKVAQIMADSYVHTGLHFSERDVPQSRLTPRQREVVQLVAEGSSSKEVAVALGLSVKTAEKHRANIMKRLDCHSVTDLVRYALKNSIIQV